MNPASNPAGMTLDAFRNLYDLAALAVVNILDRLRGGPDETNASFRRDKMSWEIIFTAGQEDQRKLKVRMRCFKSEDPVKKWELPWGCRAPAEPSTEAQIVNGNIDFALSDRWQLRDLLTTLTPVLKVGLASSGYPRSICSEQYDKTGIITIVTLPPDK